jgi:hypothetical protein
MQKVLLNMQKIHAHENSKICKKYAKKNIFYYVLEKSFQIYYIVSTVKLYIPTIIYKLRNK